MITNSNKKGDKKMPTFNIKDYISREELEDIRDTIYSDWSEELDDLREFFD